MKDFCDKNKYNCCTKNYCEIKQCNLFTTSEIPQVIPESLGRKDYNQDRYFIGPLNLYEIYLCHLFFSYT